jgi:HlyD family secretion protein
VGRCGSHFEYDNGLFRDVFRSKTSGELVLTFRSTEFLDDAARDSEATNKLEIKEKGFAFGQVSTDATEAPSANTRSDALSGRDRPMGPLSFRALVGLKTQHLDAEGGRFPLSSGMQVAGEIHLGTRSILEYLLSPVQKAWHEAGRER